MDYAFEHEGKNYTPNGTVGIVDAAQHNKELEEAEIAWIKTGPEKLFLYVKEKLISPSSWDMTEFPDRIAVTTWLGTPVSDHCWIGPRRVMGFQSCFRGGTYRRAISACIFGVTYHGWYMESSGQYCRLKKAKKQPKS